MRVYVLYKDAYLLRNIDNQVVNAEITKVHKNLKDLLDDPGWQYGEWKQFDPWTWYNEKYSIVEMILGE